MPAIVIVNGKLIVFASVSLHSELIQRELSVNRNAFAIGSNASTKSAIAEISAIADLKITDFCNSENIFCNRGKTLITRGERACKNSRNKGPVMLKVLTWIAKNHSFLQ